MADSDRRSFLVTAVDHSGSVYGTILASSIVVALGYTGGNALVMIAVLAVTDPVPVGPLVLVVLKLLVH